MAFRESIKVNIDRKLLSRVFSKIAVSTEHFYNNTPCWDWTGYLIGGYGRFHYQGADHVAHRFIYQMLVEPVNPDRHCDHLCRRRQCVNPAHVEIVTHRENVIRGVSLIAKYAQSEYCVNGHKKPEHPTSEGFRRCAECRKQKNARAALAFKNLPFDHPKKEKYRAYQRAWYKKTYQSDK